MLSAICHLGERRPQSLAGFTHGRWPFLLDIRHRASSDKYDNRDCRGFGVLAMNQGVCGIRFIVTGILA